MGFEKIIIPKQCADKINTNDYNIEIIPVSTLKQAFSVIN